MNGKQLQTRLCSLLGIQWPICQAGMGFIAQGELAGAVSAAGGLGVIGVEGLSAEQVRQAIAQVRRMTDRPFGIDILFAQVRDPENPDAISYTDSVNEFIEIAMQERVPVIISGLGSPARIIPRAHELGIKVMSIVGNVRQARRLAAVGVDALIAQGHEAGGHTGRIGGMTLLPAVVDAVDLPVIAAGGIADGRGLAAALALGACGVWMGTRFVASREAVAHDNYKQRIVEIDEEGTVISRGHSGKTCRLIRNQFTDYWEAHPELIEPFPLQSLHVGREASRRARYDGLVEEGGLPAGQVSGLIDRVLPAGEIVRQVVAEAQRTLANLCGPAA